MARLRDERPGGNEISQTTPLFAPVHAMNRVERLNAEDSLRMESTNGEWRHACSPLTNGSHSVEMEIGPLKRGTKSAALLETWGGHTLQQNIGILLETLSNK